jgi:hypothetical protein
MTTGKNSRWHRTLLASAITSLVWGCVVFWTLFNSSSIPQHGIYDVILIPLVSFLRIFSPKLAALASTWNILVSVPYVFVVSFLVWNIIAALWSRSRHRWVPLGD